MRRKDVKNKRSRGGEGPQKKQGKTWHADLHPETKKSVFAILAFIAALLFSLSFVGKAGKVGAVLYQAFDWLLGRGYFFVPISFVLIGVSLLFSESRKILIATLVGGALFLLSGLTIISLALGEGTGGFLGRIVAMPLVRFFDFWAALVVAVGFFVISVLLMWNVPIWRRRDKDADEDASVPTEIPPKETMVGDAKTALDNLGAAIKSVLEKEEPRVSAKPSIIQEEKSSTSAGGTGEEPLLALRRVAKKFEYARPALQLLQGDRGTPSSGDIKANANIIKRTLENFSIEVEMGSVAVGPTVTQYTLRPAEGVKLARIVALHNDLSLALAAHPIRIEAPIPGKSLVGIEVPNRSIALVGLRALVEHDIFQDLQHPLILALGRDVTGNPVFADLARMPHLLIGGATGAGKSVCVHTVVTSLLYRNPPEVLRFILVDPKRVELSVYNDIPHLLTPVITDPKKTIQALRWATKEMDRRYELLSSKNTRDIVGYNAQAVKSEPDALLPYLVIIIDELADLMAIFPREVESSIIRLAQMARAVGIHLIVSTQRPSVEVITGLIKANITSRIAFQVASQVDSRTIIDMAGAEKLLGNGDMLFLAGDTSKPRRIQGAFISEQEVKRVVDFLREEYTIPEYEEAIFDTRMSDDSSEGNDDVFGEDDPLFDEARELVAQAGKASASYLQRRLRVGYARAARLLDLMETRGIIGPADGAKPREVFIKGTHQAEETFVA